MQQRTASALRITTVQVVGAVAVIHLVVGVAALSRIVEAQQLLVYVGGEWLRDPRPALFLISGLAILGGLVAAGRGLLSRRRAYLLAMGALSLYLLGWVGWHTVLDHGFALTEQTAGPTWSAGAGAETPGHSHDGLLDTIGSHYLDPLVAVVAVSTSDTPGTGRVLLGIVSVTLELVGLVLLGVLLGRDPTLERTEQDTESRAGGPTARRSDRSE